MIPQKSTSQTPPLSDAQLSQFSDWTGSGGMMDTKTAALDLKRRGLVGADQIIDAQPNLKDSNSIKNSQADWKPAAIQQILANARRLNLRKPEEVNANWDTLVSNPKWRDAMNNDTFKTIHPNFRDIVTKSIIPEQYAKEDKAKIAAAINAQKSKPGLLAALNKH